MPPENRTPPPDRVSRIVQVTLLAAASVAAFTFLAARAAQSEIAAAAQRDLTASPADAEGGEPTNAAAGRISVEDETTPRELVVYFLPDKAALIPTTRARLAKWLESIGPEPPKSLSIVGHCALAGTERGRKELSVQRAENVASFLRDHGLPDAVRMTTEGRGATEPVTTNEDLQHLNRRVEIAPAESD